MMTTTPIHRTQRIHIRVRAHERAAIHRAAQLSRQTVSEWVRSVLIDAARRRIARAEREASELGDN